MVFGAKKYKVIIKGISGLIYKEGDKKISVDSELLSESLGIAIFTNSIKSWDIPFNTEVLSEEDRSRIIENIKKDLKRQKRKAILVGDGIINETAPAPTDNSEKTETHIEIESY